MDEIKKPEQAINKINTEVFKKGEAIGAMTLEKKVVSAKEPKRDFEASILDSIEKERKEIVSNLMEIQAINDKLAMGLEISGTKVVNGYQIRVAVEDVIRGKEEEIAESYANIEILRALTEQSIDKDVAQIAVMVRESRLEDKAKMEAEKKRKEEKARFNETISNIEEPVEEKESIFDRISKNMGMKDLTILGLIAVLLVTLN